MDRLLVYPNALSQDTDLLNTNKNTMVALGYLIQAILGGATQVDGMACSPSTPASLSVNVQAGSIYSLQQTDATPYGSIDADTADLIMKQGLYPGGVFTVAPPGTGLAVVYLIQAQFAELDGGPVVLPYYNASNPSQPFSGPNNSGNANYTVRQGKCVLSLKMGIPAPSGSQVAPSPDPGYVGLWTITVPNGLATVTSGNIAAAPTAPFIANKLSGKLNASQNLSDLASLGSALANLGFLGSLGANGYQKLPGGLIAQWGSVVVAGGTQAVTFPIAFPNNVFGAFIGYQWATNAFISTNTSTPTLTGMTIFNGISYSNGSAGPTATNKYLAIGN